jgi:hypothetical protein
MRLETMTSPAVPIRLAGAELGDYRHVCAFFANPEDEYRTLLPFAREGLEHGERLVQFVPRAREDHVARLRAAGIDVDGARRSQQMETRTSEDTYVREGRFDQDAMIAEIQRLLVTGYALGFPLTRLIAHAECVARDLGDADSFMEYESRLNDVLPFYPDAIICTYDLNQISAEVVIDVLRTHPMVIVGGVLQENPFFVPPEVYLREKRASGPHKTIPVTTKANSGTASARTPDSMTQG